MSHVRLPLVSREFLMSYVESESLIRDDSQCKELLLEAMKYHLLPEQRSLMVTQRTNERRPDGMRPYIFAVGKVTINVFLSQKIDRLLSIRWRKFICNSQRMRML